MMRYQSTAAFFLLLLCRGAAAFSPCGGEGMVTSSMRRTPAHRAIALRRCAAPRLDAADREEENAEDSNNYSVDWDSAWKKEVSAREEGNAGWRPEGREPVAEQAVREAQINKIADNAQANLQMAAGDWKLWVGLLAVISVATAFAGHAPAGDTYSV